MSILDFPLTYTSRVSPASTPLQDLQKQSSGMSVPNTIYMNNALRPPPWSQYRYLYNLGPRFAQEQLDENSPLVMGWDFGGNGASLLRPKLCTQREDFA